ncbi:MAG: hypothetical protein E6X17_08950 [Sporomusaceae bacterium]|nr:hypothetical protein [Sporomusaceae bacterium]
MTITASAVANGAQPTSDGEEIIGQAYRYFIPALLALGFSMAGLQRAIFCHGRKIVFLAADGFRAIMAGLALAAARFLGGTG